VCSRFIVGEEREHQGVEEGAEACGYQEPHWHDLRHVWATWHFMAGTTLGELQERSASRSETMIKRYVDFAPEQLRRAADRLATFWSMKAGRNRKRGKPLMCW
jgi:integrase